MEAALPFQGNTFRRNQNFTRDRDLGPPNDTIAAEKVDDELDNVGGALTTVKTAQSELEGRLSEQAGSFYTKTASDERYAPKGSADGKMNRAGDTTTGPVTLGGKTGAAKGVVASGTVLFDYADGNVQTVTVNGPLTFDFKDLPAAGGSLQINLTIQSGSITVAGTTWWELGSGDKSTSFGDMGLTLRTGRPYRMIIEMVAGFRTGLFQ